MEGGEKRTRFAYNSVRCLTVKSYQFAEFTNVYDPGSHPYYAQGHTPHPFYDGPSTMASPSTVPNVPNVPSLGMPATQPQTSLAFGLPGGPPPGFLDSFDFDNLDNLHLPPGLLDSIGINGSGIGIPQAEMDRLLATLPVDLPADMERLVHDRLVHDHAPASSRPPSRPPARPPARPPGRARARSDSAPQVAVQQMANDVPTDKWVALEITVENASRNYKVVEFRRELEKVPEMSEDDIAAVSALYATSCWRIVGNGGGARHDMYFVRRIGEDIHCIDFVLAKCFVVPMSKFDQLKGLDKITIKGNVCKDHSCLCGDAFNSMNVDRSRPQSVPHAARFFAWKFSGALITDGSNNGLPTCSPKALHVVPLQELKKTIRGGRAKSAAAGRSKSAKAPSKVVKESSDSEATESDDDGKFLPKHGKEAAREMRNLG